MKNLTTVFNLLLFPLLFLKRISVFSHLPKHSPQRHWKHIIFSIFVILITASSVANAVDYNLGGKKDDAEEKISNGSISRNSSDLEMAYDPGGTPDRGLQIIGLRFNNVSIPQGAIITSARIRFRADADDSGAVSLVISGESVDDASAFGGDNYELSSRINARATTAKVNWNPAAWADNTYHRTSDISSIVQEIVDRPGYAGDDLVIFIEPGAGCTDSSCRRRADSRNQSSSDAALLQVEYTVPPSCATLRDSDDLTSSHTSYTNSSNYNNSDWNVGPSATAMSRAYKFTVDRAGIVDILLYDVDQNQAKFSISQNGCPLTLDGLSSSQLTFNGPGEFYVYIYYVSGTHSNIEHKLDVNFSPPLVADATDDSYTTLINNSLSENVLINDSGAGLSVTSNTNPSHGAVTFQANGNFIYTPDSGYSGSDTFTYTITDTGGHTDTATVTIDIVNPDAVNAVNDSYSAFTDTALSGNVLINDTGTALSVTSNTNPANGTLTITRFGDFEYRSDAGFTGTDTFTYTVTDIIADSDTATVTITVSNDTNYTESSEHAFELINPPFTRNLVGNYNIAGNTVMCLTDHYSTYGGTCQDAGMEYQTSNKRISKYIDIDGDSSTWNSTSSYIDFPDTFDRDRGQRIKWAGLFWQGRISTDNDYPIHFAVVDGNSYNFAEIGKNSSYDPDIENTDANRIKLKIDTSNYNDIQASNVFTYDSSGGTTYAAFADVTSVLRAGNLSHGKHTFTVANLTTGEGREASPGVFGGWSLVVIYNENADGKLRNISIYNGFVSIDTDNDPIEISGFKLPTDVDEDVTSQMAVFSGEGEYLYGRTPYSSSSDYMKISNLSDSGWQDMPGATNPNNIFDAILDGVKRDNITGHSNNLQVNNDGVDIDNFDVTSIMTPYRNANPDMSSIFISLYSNNDYITPSMIAFSAELYKPNVCYDYVVKRDEYTIPSQGLEINATFKKGERLSITAAIKSLESDVDLELSAVGIDMRQREGTVSFDPTDAYYSLSNANTLLPTVVTNNSSQARPEIAIGKNRNALIGGTIGPYERYYAKFNYDVIDVNASKFVADFTIELNTTIDYGSGPITQILPLQQCEQSAVYNPDWLEFNVERDFSTAPSNDTEQYSLYTQIAGQDFDYSVAAYTQDANNRFTVETSVDDMTVDVELIDAEAFDDNTSFLKCSNPEPSIILGGFGNSTFVHFNNESREYVRINDFSNTRAVKNTVFRMWILTDVNNTIIPHTYNRTDGDKFKIIYDDNYAILDTAMICADDCGVYGVAGSSACYNCLRNNFAKPICSRDNFAIRPESYRISLSDIGVDGEAASPLEVTQNNSSMTDKSLAAGYDYNLTGQSTNFNGSTSNGYYGENFSIATRSTLPSPNAYEDMAVLQFTGSSTCQDQNHSTLNIKFTNGILDTYTLSHNNVGDYALWIEDNSWTKVDQASQNPYKTIFDNNCRVDTATAAPAYCNDCILGNNTSGGADTKPGCTIDSILTANTDYQEIDLTFNPYQFDLDLQFVRRPAGSSTDGIVYFSDLNDDLAMSIGFTGRITAQGFDGTPLNNFITGCAAQDIMLDVNKTTLPGAVNDINDINISFQQVLNDITGTTNPAALDDVNLTYDALNFTDDLNGSANINLFYNFAKPQNVPMNPVEVNITRLTASSPNASSNANMSTNFVPDGNISGEMRRFYYARTVPGQTTYDDIKEDFVLTSLHVQIFCFDAINLAFCATMGLDSVAYPIVANEIAWYSANAHDPGDGQITTIGIQSGPGNIAPSGGPYQFNSGSRADLRVNYSGIDRPETDVVAATVDTWLRYNGNTIVYNVIFTNDGNWAGIGKTGNVLDTLPKDKANKRISW